MPDDTLLKQRLRDASTEAVAPAGELAPVIHRARILRARRWTAGAVACALIVAALVVPAAALRHLHQGADLQGATRLSASGLSAEIPSGWRARILDLPGLGGASLQATTGTLPPTHDLFDATLPGDGIRVGVVNVSALCPCAGFSVTATIGGFRPNDWYRPDPVGSDRTTRVFQRQGGYVKLVKIGHRSFVVWAGFPQRPAPANLLAQVNALLDSIATAPKPPAQPLKHPPVSIPRGAAGVLGTAWSAGSSHPPTPPTAMAWSIPLGTEDLISTGLEGAFWFYPTATVDPMPRGGVVVVATSLPPTFHVDLLPSLHLSEATVEQHWEGEELPRITRYELEGRFVGTRIAKVDVYFGNPHPTPAMRALAQSILDRVEFYPNG
jgi:hypothetical protein